MGIFQRGLDRLSGSNGSTGATPTNGVHPGGAALRATGTEGLLRAAGAL